MVPNAPTRGMPQYAALCGHRVAQVAWLHIRMHVHIIGKYSIGSELGTDRIYVLSSSLLFSYYSPYKSWGTFKYRFIHTVGELHWATPWSDLCFGGIFFRKCVVPEGLAKEFPQITQILQCLGSIDYMTVSPISTCQCDAKNSPDALKHLPDLFWQPRGRKILSRVSGPEIRCCLIMTFTSSSSNGQWHYCASWAVLMLMLVASWNLDAKVVACSSLQGLGKATQYKFVMGLWHWS